MRGVWASLCTECHHLASEHLWHHKEGGTLTAGPYVCTLCGCSQPQDGPFLPMDRQGYETYMAGRS